MAPRISKVSADNPGILAVNHIICRRVSPGVVRVLGLKQWQEIVHAWDKDVRQDAVPEFTEGCQVLLYPPLSS